MPSRPRRAPTIGPLVMLFFWIATWALETTTMSCTLPAIVLLPVRVSCFFLKFGLLASQHNQFFWSRESLTNSEQGRWQKRCAPLGPTGRIDCLNLWALAAPELGRKLRTPKNMLIFTGVWH